MPRWVGARRGAPDAARRPGSFCASDQPVQGKPLVHLLTGYHWRVVLGWWAWSEATAAQSSLRRRAVKALSLDDDVAVALQGTCQRKSIHLLPREL